MTEPGADAREPTADEIALRERETALDQRTRAIEAALAAAERHSRRDDRRSRDICLRDALRALAEVSRLGVDRAFAEAVDRRIGNSLMTSPPGVDATTKAAMAERRSAWSGRSGGRRENRRVARYVHPHLSVEIGGVAFETADWSHVGLSLLDYKGRPPLRAGARVRVRMSCAGIVPRGLQPARVLVAENGRLALEFPDISTRVLDLIAGLRRLGIQPRW